MQQVFATAHDITPEWHIKLQAAFQKSTDNAVSKTVNFPNEATIEDVENVYRMAFRTGCKGVTIYRDGSRDEQVLNVGQTKKKREPDPAAGGIATTRPARPQLLTGETQRMDTGCGKLFVIMNDDEYGPREVFANMGKAGGCASSNTEALGRLISLALKKGASAQEIVEQLKGIRCHVPYGMGPNATLSCADAIGKALERRYVAGAAAQAERRRPSRSSRWSRSRRARAPTAAAPSSTRAAARCAGPGLRLLQVRVSGRAVTHLSPAACGRPDRGWLVAGAAPGTVGRRAAAAARSERGRPTTGGEP